MRASGSLSDVSHGGMCGSREKHASGVSRQDYSGELKD